MSTSKPRNIAVTLECFVKKDGKYLMLHRGPHKRIMPNVWMAPGGHREFNEGLFACARREVREETNLEIKNLEIRATGNAYVADNDTEFFFHFVFADYASGELKTSTDDGEFVWLSMEEVLAMDNLLPEIKMVLPEIIGSTRPVSFSAEYKAGNELVEFCIEDPS